MMMRLSYQFLMLGKKEEFKIGRLRSIQFLNTVSSHLVTDYVLLELYNQKAVYCLTLF